MKLTEYIIAAAIGLLVGIGAYLIVNKLIINEDHFQAKIEVVKPLTAGFNADATDVFTDKNRVDFSSPVQLGTEADSQPFVSGSE